MASIITRIKRIQDFRMFQGWTWPSAAPEFKRINVVYGVNGSGKSTLATLLDGCAQGSPPSAGTELEVKDGGIASTITESDSAFWPRVRVFNRDYVARNLGFDRADGPAPVSLLTLGEMTVQRQEELKTAKDELDELRRRRASAEEAKAAREKARRERLTQTARIITGELGGLQQYNPRSYTAANVRRILEGNRALLDSGSSDVSADLSIVNAQAKAALTRPTLSALIGEAGIDRSKQLVGTQVVAPVLAELDGRADRTKWVQEGIALHQGMGHCLYCGQELTPDRVAALNAHFDSAVEKVQQEIDRYSAELKASQDAVTSYLSALPIKDQFYQDLAPNVIAALASFAKVAEAYRRGIDTILELLRAKHADPFQVPDYPESLSLVPPATAEIDGLIADHNDRANNHAASVGQAACGVELARIREIAKEHDADSKAVNDAQTLIARLTSEIEKLEQRIVTLENVAADPVPKAEWLGQEVKRLLGRSELEFSATADGQQYVIRRRGEPARNLSEGERTAIALLYFLASVEPTSQGMADPILVFDDPASSLDHEILYGVSAEIWAATVNQGHVAQTFVLTHNFELFREWLIRCEQSGNHITGGYLISELRVRSQVPAGAQPRRVPSLEPWNKELSKRLRSQYHFWFHRIANALIAAAQEPIGLAERMELFALTPNAARKMLEGFLAFRYPGFIGSFHEQMRHACDDLGNSPIRNHVERYLHAFSHNEEGDISTMIEPEEAPAVIQSLFRMMKELDCRHFKEMCDALGIDAALLLGSAGTEAG